MKNTYIKYATFLKPKVELGYITNNMIETNIIIGLQFFIILRR